MWKSQFSAQQHLHHGDHPDMDVEGHRKHLAACWDQIEPAAPTSHTDFPCAAAKMSIFLGKKTSEKMACKVTSS